MAGLREVLSRQAPSLTQSEIWPHHQSDRSPIGTDATRDNFIDPVFVQILEHLPPVGWFSRHDLL